ncbi:hypothetical protein [Hymenobacter sp. DG01]|uniref:hypothetical protein n=1 Tax=Hymenobacter sp. DG01 TaxID=2584940 RepID=UPI00112403B2|nr:hypothetical protein [Hymenobacter sp. DG01]
MEKLQTLAWILLGLVMFIWRMVQKARATTAQEQRERKFTRPDSRGRPRPVAPGLPGTSFEELLRQMQTQNQGGAAPSVPQPEATPAGRPLPRETAPAPRSLEQNAPTRSLEAPARPARRAATLPRAGQQSTPDYWQRQQARPEEAPASSFAERLRNPADVRMAFVLGEILQRKF